MDGKTTYMKTINWGEESSFEIKSFAVQRSRSSWWFFSFIAEQGIWSRVRSTPFVKGDQTVLNLCRRKISGSPVSTYLVLVFSFIGNMKYRLVCVIQTFPPLCCLFLFHRRCHISFTYPQAYLLALPVYI